MPPPDNDERGDGNDGVTAPLPDNDRMVPDGNGNGNGENDVIPSTLNDADRVGAGVAYGGVELADNDTDVT